MLNIVTDIQPLSQLIQHPDDVIAQVKRTGNPVVLTVDGKADLVVMDAAAYEAMQMDHALTLPDEELHQSIADADTGRVRPMREVLTEIMARHGL